MDFYTSLIEFYLSIITFMVKININGCATTLMVKSNVNFETIVCLLSSCYLRTLTMIYVHAILTTMH